jgi:hypothetical protein
MDLGVNLGLRLRSLRRIRQSKRVTKVTSIEQFQGPLGLDNIGYAGSSE